MNNQPERSEPANAPDPKIVKFLTELEADLDDFKKKLNEIKPGALKSFESGIDKTLPLDEIIGEIGKLNFEAKEILSQAGEIKKLVKDAGAESFGNVIGEITGEIAKALEDRLASRGVTKKSESLVEFYILYGITVESFNKIRVFYQVLLEEYDILSRFNPRETFEIKKRAAINIAKCLCRQAWRGKEAIENRAEFRFEMVEQIRRKIHDKPKREKASALCLSGGGIRSATFNLGILQGLARHNLLDKFDYLSTVSGGGFIGSWLSAWIYQTRVKLGAGAIDKTAKLSREYVRKVQKRLAQERGDEDAQREMEYGEVEPLEITHLRNYSNYMSPRLGLFSADTWTLVAVYLRNLLLNWTVFLPLMAALLLVPRLLFGFVYLNTVSGTRLLLIAAVIGGILAIAYLIAMRPTLSEFSGFTQNYKTDDIGVVTSVESKVLRRSVFPLILLAFGTTTFWVWRQRITSGQIPGFGEFVLFGIALFVIGGVTLFPTIWIFEPVIQRITTRASKKTTENADKKKTGDRKGGITLHRTIFRFFVEAVIAILTGMVGGAMLYLLTLVFPKPDADKLSMDLFFCFGIPLFMIVFLLSTAFFIGVASKITDDMDREWMSRFGGWILIVAFGWSLVTSIVILGPRLFTDGILGWINGTIITAIGGLSGLVTLVLGFSRKSTTSEDKKPKSPGKFLMWFAPQIAAPIFAVFLMILIVFGSFLLISKQLITQSGAFGWVIGRLSKYVVELDAARLTNSLNLETFLWFLAFLIVGCLMGWWININKFSLHATYRERLIRAYLGASRAKVRLETANSFTGLDTKDNVDMEKLFHKPFHVVNMTLNLVKPSNLRWQNRKAESFTATALHCGSSNMGDGSGNYRKSEEYGLNPQNNTPISLGTAAAISGAAASPNMGYYTSSFGVSFLMALFNVRLGWWLGNPGSRGNKTYNLAAPRFSPRLFFAEALGNTTDTHPYIYLSDGGHFDNLGLYEMVLRRVHVIVACDAGADADFRFGDFGTAIHKIRVDMGIPIEFAGKNAAPTPGRNCGIATIKYSVVDGNSPEDDGILIYIKPTLDGDEPIDIVNYKRLNDDFPHEGTADQMYSETQFETYRKLGSHMINSICCDDTNNIPCERCRELSHLVKHAQWYVKKKQREADEIGGKKRKPSRKTVSF